jgi:hypothetical protein
MAMAETMIERVAREMFRMRRRDQGASYFGGQAEIDTDWSVVRSLYIDDARAIMAAMRQPTDKMIDAGYGDTKGDPDHSGCSDNPLPDDSWPRMIDAAIGEAS